jgi:hypothetical protein
LLNAVIGAFKDLLGRAQQSANSWNKKTDVAALSFRQQDFKEKVGKSKVEQWAINKSVHYNEWVQLKKQDFSPVVEAFEDLLACFRCDSCNGLMYVSPPNGQREILRCDCGACSFNLKTKEKS